MEMRERESVHYIMFHMNFSLLSLLNLQAGKQRISPFYSKCVMGYKMYDKAIH